MLFPNGSVHQASYQLWLIEAFRPTRKQKRCQGVKAQGDGNKYSELLPFCTFLLVDKEVPSAKLGSLAFLFFNTEQGNLTDWVIE